MDYTKVNTITRTCTCTDYAYERKDFAVGRGKDRFMYTCRVCLNCGNRYHIRRIDPKTLKEVDADGN